MEKFIINFSDITMSQGANGSAPLGGTLPISAHTLVKSLATKHNYDEEIIYNNYAVFFTLALPTNGWKNRLKKHNPTCEEQKEYFESKFNNFQLPNKSPFIFMYSLEYNENMANIHAHGVIHQYTCPDLTRFKKQLRIIFKIDCHNRVAIKYYKTEHPYIPEKYIYHLKDKDYNNNNKNNNKLDENKTCSDSKSEQLIIYHFNI